MHTNHIDINNHERIDYYYNIDDYEDVRHFTYVPTIKKKQNKTSHELHATRTLSHLYSNTHSPPFFSSHSRPSSFPSHTLPLPSTPHICPPARPSAHRSTPQWLAPAPSGQIHHKSCSCSSSDSSFQNSWNPSVTHGTHARILFIVFIFLFFHFLFKFFDRRLFSLSLSNNLILLFHFLSDSIFIVHCIVLFCTWRELYY